MNDIAVVVPIFNEEGNVKELALQLNNVLSNISSNYEIIFVDDGSTDTSLSIIKELSLEDKHIKYVSFTRNFGHQIAVYAGLNKCDAETCVIIDADLQDPPELILGMYEKWKRGVKIVYAKRIKREGETFLKKWTAKLFYRLFSRIIDFNIPLDTGDYRLVDKKVVTEILKMSEKNLFLRGQIAWTGFSMEPIEYIRNSRNSGKTNYSYKKMIKFALDGIVSFSNVPLKLVTFLGLSVTVIDVCIIIYTLISKFVFKTAIDGWTSIMISSLFMGGVQLLSIGIIGEYISRINSNVLNRPLFIVAEEN